MSELFHQLEVADWEAALDKTARRFDANFIAIDQAIGELRKAKLAKPRRAHRRSSAAARVNPDRLWFGYTIAGINAIFILGAFIVSFAGQYAFAERTRLAEEFFWFIPLALDLPIVASAFTAAVFRKRKQRARANLNWLFIAGLTIASSVIQATHVLDVDGAFTGSPIDWPAGLGVGIMAAMPLLVLFLSENLAGLLVKPVGEAPDKGPLPRRQPASRKTPTRKAVTR